MVMSCVRVCMCVCLYVCDTLLFTRYLRRVTWTDFILDVHFGHTEQMIPIVYGGGQRSFDVTGGQIIKLV